MDKRKTHIRWIAANDLDISDWKWSCAPTQRQNFTFFFSFFVLQLNLLMWSEGTSGRLSEINDPYFPSEASPHRGQMVRDVRVSGRSLILFFIWKGMAQTDVRNQDYVSVLRCFPRNKRFLMWFQMDAFSRDRTTSGCQNNVLSCWANERKNN